MAIALITDFGTRDHFAASMKGVILSIVPNIAVIDITHEIAPQAVSSASFVLWACFRDFPENTIFAAVVDPGVGSARRAVVVAAGKYHFVAPDNGLLNFVFDEFPDFEAYELAEVKFQRLPVSSTFHGRDIFAPAAAYIAAGAKAEEFGPRVIDPVRSASPRPERISENAARGRILHIDRFGNLITNVRRPDLPEGAAIEIAGRRIQQFRDCYFDAVAGEIFLIEGSSGLVEISVREASASEILNAKIGGELILHFGR